MRNTLTIEGLFLRFLEIKGTEMTGKEAYNLLYKEHVDRYGIEPRYSTYDSFRVNMGVYYKNRRKTLIS